MSARRNIWLLTAVAVAGAQAGHLLTYALRYGASAPQVQTAGAHWYFPTEVKVALGLCALGFVAALFVIGAGRVISGRRLETRTSPPFLRVLSVLFSLQLAAFVIQETAEGLVGGAHLSSAPALLLTGAAGQLPVALIAAVAVRWLLARLDPALAAMQSRPVGIRQRHVLSFEVRVLAPAPEFVPVTAIALSLTRRGPPSF